MAISLKSLKKTQNLDAPRTLIYGPPKRGKTTLASEWPNSVYIQTERGTPGGLVLDTFGDIESYQDVLDAVMVLATEETGFKNVVIDTADRLDTLICQVVCNQNKWENIEEPGYGKGYAISGHYWKQLLYGVPNVHPGLQGLVDIGMSVTLIAHSEMVTFNDPTAKSYNKWEIRLNKHVLGIVQDWVDFIIHLDVAVGETEDKGSFGNKRNRSAGGNQRWITTDGTANTTAGNRYGGMPKKFPYMIGKGFETISQFIPHYNGGVTIEETVVEKQEETTEQAA